MATTNQPHKNRERLTVPQLAEYLQISIYTAYLGLRAGQIPSRRVGQSYIIFRDAIDEWRRCGVS
jgi:excisionase family DNA binding protein